VSVPDTSCATVAQTKTPRRVRTDEYRRGEAQNVQINAAFGIARLRAKGAGLEGRQRLLNGLPGSPTRRRDAMLKALAMLVESPAR
jgi:hypothetical protein